MFPLDLEARLQALPGKAAVTIRRENPYLQDVPAGNLSFFARSLGK